MRLDLRGGLSPRLHIGEMLHPVALAAVVLLMVNDWLLKRSTAPGWLTGKLSDVAGLVFAPLALTALMGLVTRRPLTARRLAGALGLTASVFIAVKILPGFAALAARAWGTIAPGARIVADPTDLLCLPALAVAVWIARDELRWIAAASDARQGAS